MTLAITASWAEVVKSYNFESGTTNGWSQPKDGGVVKVVELPRGEGNKKALSIDKSTFTSVTAPRTGTKYGVSFEYKSQGKGTQPARLVVNIINPETKRFEKIIAKSLPKRGTFGVETIEFTAPYKGYVRINIIPASDTKIVIDNFKIITK